jgi:Zn-dependent M16 (insulinase) family peptidase
MFYSYRDPSPEAALSVYKKAPAFLRELASAGKDLTKFIIGAYGDYDILTTPRTEATQALYDYMTGWSAEKELALKEGILSANGDGLCLAADIIEEAFASSSVCVIGESGAIGRVTPPLTVFK